MEKGENLKQLTTVCSNPIENTMEIHPHLMIAVSKVEVLQQYGSQEFSHRLICETECSNERFEIIVLQETAISGMQFKYKFIRKALEQLSGWKVHFFKMYSPLFSNDKIISDRRMKQLYINEDMLRMPLRALLNLIGKVSELLKGLTGHMRIAVGGLDKSNDSRSLRFNQQAAVVLSVGKLGLCLPPQYVFSADELFVHVSIHEYEIYLRFASGLRMFYQSSVPLPYYIYKTPIEVIQGSYAIPFPIEVCHELGDVTKGVHFEVHTD